MDDNVELDKRRKSQQLHRWQWWSWITSTETNVKNDNIDNDELEKLGGKFELLEYCNERTAIVQKLLKNLPEPIQTSMERKLNVAFGLAPAPT